MPLVVSAHPGRLDSSGGHNCNVGACAGTYHGHENTSSERFKDSDISPVKSEVADVEITEQEREELIMRLLELLRIYLAEQSK